MNTHELAGRMAQCPYCKTTVPSDENLPFFEYRGPGSRHGKLRCAKCGFIHAAWTGPNHPFVPDPSGSPMDSYYCGCRGWD